MKLALEVQLIDINFVPTKPKATHSFCFRGNLSSIKEASIDDPSDQRKLPGCPSSEAPVQEPAQYILKNIFYPEHIFYFYSPPFLFGAAAAMSFIFSTFLTIGKSIPFLRQHRI